MQCFGNEGILAPDEEDPNLCFFIVRVIVVIDKIKHGDSKWLNGNAESVLGCVVDVVKYMDGIAHISAVQAGECLRLKGQRQSDEWLQIEKQNRGHHKNRPLSLVDKVLYTDWRFS